MHHAAIQCPLCKRKEVDPFFEDKNRSYLQCINCQLVFVPKDYWLSREDEKSIYDLHENNPQDQGYRKFLSRLVNPLLERLTSGQKGLDFGCGPGPTLSVMFEEEGYKVDPYDPIYLNKPEVFSNSYDFICATEVVEHLRDPKEEFSKLFKMLKPGGWLGLMTKLVIDKNAFKKWHYIHDLTHICFYSRNTFKYVSDYFNMELSFIGKDVILLKKEK
jgi:2-polyprenyl-3-methyl-5-hydroxy-6-metoxy-1,4-benzoquinol methylase